MLRLGFLLDIFFPLRPSKQLERNIDTEKLGAFVAPVSIASVPVPTIALLPYREPLVQALIIECKFYKSEKAAGLLGTVLADFLRERVADDSLLNPSRFIMVPIPLGASRKRERGYNQMELVCRVAESHLNGTVEVQTGILTRIKETVPQTSLSGAARKENMHHAFDATTPLDPTYTYIVVDDVTTTGATLGAAVEALYRAGAIHIMPLALAH